MLMFFLAKEAVPGCVVKNLREDDLHTDELAERLMMCNLFHNCTCELPLLKQSSLSATKGYTMLYTVEPLCCGHPRGITD